MSFHVTPSNSVHFCSSLTFVCMFVLLETSYNNNSTNWSASSWASRTYLTWERLNLFFGAVVIPKELVRRRRRRRQRFVTVNRPAHHAAASFSCLAMIICHSFPTCAPRASVLYSNQLIMLLKTNFSSNQIFEMFTTVGNLSDKVMPHRRWDWSNYSGFLRRHN